MLRIWYLSVLAATLAPGQGRPDPAFDKVPFDDWLKGHNDAHIHWSLRVFPAYLGESQRLETSVTAVVDADDFLKRSKRGRVVVFLEIRDHDNRAYRSRRVLSLSKRHNPADVAAVKFIQHACIVPGDYEVAAAVYDAASKEHSLKRTKLRVKELPHDPLPGAWRGLPNVELASTCDPARAAPISLPVETKKPVRVEVVVNQTVNRYRKNGAGYGHAAILLPRLEVIAAMEIRLDRCT